MRDAIANARRGVLLLVVLAACTPTRSVLRRAVSRSVQSVFVDRSVAQDTMSATSAPDSTPPAGVTTLPALVVAPDEVVRTAVAVFGDSVLHPVDSSVAVDANAAAMANEEPSWDLDVRSFETHDRVAHYVALFTNRARETFSARLSRGTRYEAMIRAKLRAGGLPEDLHYLALVESGYDPHAYSRAAAVGMWQFMSSTARAVGLRVDWWVDDRRDPARSTDAAVRFLDYLQKQYGSWYLAAAAYNGGPGRVARGLTRFADELEGRDGEERFFALAEQNYLRAETKNYVPQLIAAALVAKMPAKYALRYDTLSAYAYDSVRALPGTPLGLLVTRGGLPDSAVRTLNPSILRGITPPDAPTWLRVPNGDGLRVQTILDGLRDDERVGYQTLTLRGSRTTWRDLTERFGVGERQLRWFNPGARLTKGRLAAGQTIRIPDSLTIRYALGIPDPSIERYGGGNARTLSARGVHVVRRGETLGSIARRYGISERQLRTLNGLRSSRLLAGQSLQVRTGQRSTTARGAKGASTTSAKGKATKAKSTKAKSTKSKSPKGKSTKAKSSNAKGAPKSSSARKTAAKKTSSTAKPASKSKAPPRKNAR